MPRKNKFIKGNKLTNMTQLLIQVNKGRYVYFNHKPQHPGIIKSMTLNTLLNAIYSGMLYTTKENK